MKKIVEFHVKYNRYIERSDNLIIAIALYYVTIFVVFALAMIIEFNYSSTVCELILLIVFLGFYLDVRQKNDAKEIWIKRKMNLKIFVLIISSLIVAKFIFSIETNIVREIKGVEDNLIPGTVDYVGTSFDKILRATIIGPIVEELIFRGIGLKSFKKNDNKLEAIIFTAVTFGLMHQNLVQAISGIIGGFIYGYVAIEFGILYSIICHMLYNGMFYIAYFLNIDKLMQFIAVLIIAFWVWNRKEMITEIKNHLTCESKYSVKRQLVYFLNFPLLLFYILWVWMIISSI